MTHGSDLVLRLPGSAFGHGPRSGVPVRPHWPQSRSGRSDSRVSEIGDDWLLCVPSTPGISASYPEARRLGDVVARVLSEDAVNQRLVPNAVALGFCPETLQDVWI